MCESAGDLVFHAWLFHPFDIVRLDVVVSLEPLQEAVYVFEIIAEPYGTPLAYCSTIKEKLLDTVSVELRDLRHTRVSQETA